MNAQKMTQKSLEAVQAAQSLAVEYETRPLRRNICSVPFWGKRTA